MKRFLLFCSGANREILRRCPSEETKYAGIGATILLTSLLATLSGGYALYTVFGSVTLAVAFGLLWGSVIFNLDRVIVSSMRKQRNWGLDLLYALPRIGVAVLLAVVVSRPLELRLFEPDIRRAWVQRSVEEREGALEAFKVQSEGLGERLQNEITTREAAIRELEAAVRATQDSLVAETAGRSSTGIPGAGSVYRALEEKLRGLKADLSIVTAREEPLIALARVRLDSISREAVRYGDRMTSNHQDGLGLLGRMKMLEALKEESPAVHKASLAVTLLFLALELAPVLVKLLSTLNPYRPYDELLEQHEFEIVEAARQDVNVRRQALRNDAKRRTHESQAAMEAEMDLDVRRHELRRDAEMQANEALVSRIAVAQVEVAERVVDGWRDAELVRVAQNPDAYMTSVT